MRSQGRGLLATALLASVIAANAVAQEPAHDKPAPPVRTKEGSSVTGHSAKGSLQPTHAPQPSFSPVDAWNHVKKGNEAAAAARARREALPPPQSRPAGAGRHLCAVVVCADCNLDVPALLGLPRQDVLLISTPGPFVTPEITAMLEQAVAQERLSLVLMLTHTNCTTLDTTRGVSPQQDALAQRLAAARAEAERLRTSLGRALLLGQRERLFAASDELQKRAAADSLRVIPGELNTRTGAITWLHRAVDAMPMPPVR